VTTEIQQNRYDQILRRVGGLIGPGSKVSEVISELFPMFDVENLPPELMLLGGTRLCIGGGNVVGAAGERPRIQLFNPADSGLIVTVTSADISSVQAQTINYATQNIGLAVGTGIQRFKDKRLPFTSLPTAGIFTDSQVAIVSSIGNFTLTANASRTIDDRDSLAILAPGFGFSVGGTAVATQILVTLNWRERTAEPSELNL